MNEPQDIMNLHKTLVKSKLYIFPNKGKINISNKRGVYIIYDSSGRVLHVGNTPSGKGGLNQRLYNHVTHKSSFSRLYLRPREISLRNYYGFRIVEVDSPRKRVLLEALTAGLLCPAHIGTGEKKKEQIKALPLKSTT